MNARAALSYCFFAEVVDHFVCGVIHSMCMHSLVGEPQLMIL